MNRLQPNYPLPGPAGTLLIVLIAALTSGCAGVLVGGAATGAVVVHDERTTGTFIEDQSIELKAIEAIRGNAELKQQTHISVTSYNQVALVTGQAPNDELRQAAILLVSQVDKVRAVFNEIELAAPNSMTNRTSDALVTGKVKTKLFTVDDLDATRVKVVTENGVVYLMGIMNRADADRAAVAASYVGGVDKVVKLFEYKD